MLLQKRIQELNSAILDIQEDKTIVTGFYSEERLEDYINGSDCLASLGMYPNEPLDMAYIKDNALFIILNDGQEVSRHKFILLKKDVVKYKNPLDNTKLKSTTYSIRKCVFTDKFNYMDADISLLFDTLIDLMEFFYDKFGVNMIMKYDFVAIDFETANAENSSACSIGLVAVINNQISETFYSLIKPQGLHFEKKNIDVHGITPDDVKDAPSFKDIWEQIQHYFIDNIIVAHNAVFDMSVLKQCLLLNRLELPDFNYVCSIPFSNRACDSRTGTSLKDRADYFGIKLENHHNSLDDALTCAKLVLICIEIERLSSFESYCKTYNDISIKNFEELKPQKRFGKSSRFETIRISDLTPTNSICDESHILYGKNIVFTGEYTALTRRTAMQMAIDMGANVRSGVSKKTDYLVVGAQDKKIVGDDGMSNKEEKAYALIDEGYDISIISEDEYLELVGYYKVYA